MLMVAATFPVGIEQTRIATQETMIPLVVDDAANTLRLLLSGNQGRPTNIAGLAAPVVARTVLIDNVIGSTALAGASPALTECISGVSLPSKGALADSPSFNDWLGPVRDYPTPSGAQPGVGQAGTTGSPYTWFVLFRYPLSGNSIGLDVLLLVARRTSMLPVWVIAERVLGDTTNKTVRIRDPGRNADVRTNQELAALVGPGLSLAYVDSGSGQFRVLRVATVNASTATIATEDPATGLAAEGTNGSDVWIIPKDLTTGVSPVIGWQVRSIPLN